MIRWAKKWLPFVLVITATGLWAGCGFEPDTSAPDRVEIERASDWHGALLYIADSTGPNPEFGSVRVYDNVSGFVEITVEQTRAAAPSDIFVTSDGTTMYVASSANGLIDKFRWDGNSWVSGSFEIETPSTSLVALDMGPDGRLYAVDASPGAAGSILAIDPASDQVLPGQTAIPGLGGITGISWPEDGRTAYITGISASGASVFLTTDWPFSRTISTAQLPLAGVRQVLTSPDGRFVYVMGRGEILKVEAGSGTPAGSLRPATDPATEYADGDFSADGRYLFVAGTTAGSDSTLYVIDLETSQVVETVEHISRTAGGIQRVE